MLIEARILSLFKTARLNFPFYQRHQPKANKSFSAAMSEAIDKFEEQKQKAKIAAAAEVANKEDSNIKEDDTSARFIKHRLKKRKWEEYNLTKQEDSTKRANFDPAERVKRKKTAIVVGYSGANYFGMQRNPGMKTIEEELFTVMLKHKWITEDGYEQAQNANFQRAARTDKGVSAARQVCSVKLPDNLDIASANADLPEQIRIFGARRVTKGFNAKDQCNARTYTYTLPTVAFGHHTVEHEFETFRINPDQLKRLNEILAMYEGTKNFHNFTSRKQFLDPSAKRYIMSFSCSEPFLSPQGVEFATIKVKGQSFMLHQIRKMVGLTIAVVRGNTTTKTIERAFTEERLDLPMAPGLGLVLDTVHYDRYNERYGSDGIHEPLTWAAETDEINAFIEKYIYSNIYETEFKEKSLVAWIETLSLHSYAERQSESKVDETAEKNGSGDDEE